MNIKGEYARGLSSSSIISLLKTRAYEVRESPQNLGYKPLEDWPKLPSGWKLGPVAGVACDSEGRYYIFHRGKESPPLLCFDRNGNLTNSWGKDVFIRPHMAKCDEDNNIWLIDDEGHTIYLYSSDGKLLKTIGTTGVQGMDGSHFNRPTDITWSDEFFFISDGYGNKRVAKFDRDLKFLGQWGSEGIEKGQFLLPHAISTANDGLVYVADRTNWRVEIFTSDGEFLKEWSLLCQNFLMIRCFLEIILMLMQ